MWVCCGLVNHDSFSLGICGGTQQLFSAVSRKADKLAGGRSLGLAPATAAAPGASMQLPGLPGVGAPSLFQ